MTDRLRWVLDTNVLISRLLAPGGAAAEAADRALSSGILLVSEATLNELITVLDRPKFSPYISVADRREFIRLLGGVSRFVEVLRPVRACRDPDDDKFLDVALAGEAQAIITGDKDLLALDPFHGIRIVTPIAFLDWG
ncbi:putative toxin-antitoxin system toxin component, PIN family [Methylonatrum kenyense]|uniref:putative toxin-antitoxin system toxin component, PIN family n=1 Tax=Methylonatrum kenyense TaxID=455253 RepID=UPI0020BF42D9|nr:putative toxin-antitoxin system toxin component, PIN family [Methylonatrum kenyense]MCK8516984.1 putative toxin-antitoxin system toxin component, PIN family [Methylonatrum kenyense]